MYTSVEKSRVAVPTKGRGGLDDVVSEVFGRANTFTIVDIEKGTIKNFKVLENPAVSYQHGAGPIVVKMLLDEGVNIVIATEFGPGVLTLLDQHKVTKITATAGTSVAQSLKELLTTVEE
ncbi:MAG: NifB/NifX family molybdenum-iron cluster-binding protein [Dehalococcoidia bacterium]|nr:NifB/NifX family molybdenum-iron cluster-binding protein [Dehalococcoidia bacterium]